MDRLREYGTVVELDGDTAKVMFKRSSACGHCTACGLLKDMSEIIVDVPNTLYAQPGNRVEVEFSSETTMKSAGIAYVFPLIMLIIGGVIGYAISGFINLNSDVTAAIGCILFTALSFLVIKMMEPTFKKKFEKIYKMVKVFDNTGEEQNNG